jgi:RNA 2',3'-cyclic 3'-phosphodiesterase
MRCFIAIALTENLRENLSKAAEKMLYPGVKTVRKRNLHVTLKYLGETQKARDMASLLDEIQHSRFNMSVEGLSAFPNASEPRIIWAKIMEGQDQLICLQRLIDDKTSQLGFEKDKRFHPHITLARAKNPPSKVTLTEIIKSYGGVAFGQTNVCSIHLMRSHIKREGPEYEIMHTSGLGKDL